MTKIKLSVDDGCASDVRVADLATKYGIDCTFYWPVEWHSLAYDNGYKPLRFQDALDIASNFTVGSHTITHRHLTKLDEQSAIYEIQQSKLLLKRIFNQPIDSFCPPRGYVNEKHIPVIETNYLNYRLTRGEGLVHIHPNSGANGNVHWRDYAKNHVITEAWCHSHELDRFNLWEEFEQFLREHSLGK